jgi:6-phosphofructokinase 1
MTENSMGNFNIKRLGECKFISPLNLSEKYGDKLVNYVTDKEKISYYLDYKTLSLYKEINDLPFIEKAGPRKELYFNPKQIKCAVVTCGGLAPGLNDVIRALVMELHWLYGVQEVLGIRYGYRGFIEEYNYKPYELTPEKVSEIHSFGGTILGSSRGRQDEKKIVDFLVENEISVLFCIGGDGTLRGAHKISSEISERNLKISIIGIPKTIDNDIAYMDKTFGFETAFSKAAESIKAAHYEAKSVYNGIGLVKLMGRHSGYIAANAALALKEVNFVLIPEVNFDLYGENGLFECLKKRLSERRHAVIVIAEGAGQEYLIEKDKNIQYDASGNIKLKDIGLYLKEKIGDYFKKDNYDYSLKYIDPSYIIRSLPANPSDSSFCGKLAQNAVHAGLAGKTDMVVGYLNSSFVHIPIETAISCRKQIDPESDLWRNVLEATGQKAYMIN